MIGNLILTIALGALAASGQAQTTDGYLQQRLQQIPENDCTGECQDACESKLCLMGQIIPTECVGPISRFVRKAARRPGAGKDYLEKCDDGDQSGLSGLIMRAHFEKCLTSESLAARLTEEERSNRRFLDERHLRVSIPQVCRDLANHPWTRIALPVQEAYACYHQWGGDWGRDGEICSFRWLPIEVEEADVTFILNPEAFLREQGIDLRAN